MASLNDCYSQHQGTAVSFDGLAEDKGQCLQWVSIVNRDVNGKPAFYTPAAKDWWYNFKGSPLEPYYDQIPKGQPVKKGDFVIYDPLSSTDPQGHIDVAAADGTVTDFMGYDSNWDATNFHDASGFPTLHEVHHNDSLNQFIVGYLRLKGEDMGKWDNGKTYNLLFHACNAAIAKRAQDANYVGYFGAAEGVDAAEAFDGIIASPQFDFLVAEARSTGTSVTHDTALAYVQANLK